MTLTGFIKVLNNFSSFPFPNVWKRLLFSNFLSLSILFLLVLIQDSLFKVNRYLEVLWILNLICSIYSATDKVHWISVITKNAPLNVISVHMHFVNKKTSKCHILTREGDGCTWINFDIFKGMLHCNIKCVHYLHAFISLFRVSWYEDSM